MPTRLLPPLLIALLGLLFFAELVVHPTQVLYSDYSAVTLGAVLLTETCSVKLPVVSAMPVVAVAVSCRSNWAGSSWPWLRPGRPV